MLKIDGTNQFADGYYSWYDWSADVYQIPEEVLQAFKQLKISGRKIIDFRAVGALYSDVVSIKRAIQNGDLSIKRCVQIDWPLILYLDDGGRFEIDYSDSSCVRMSKDAFPDTICRKGTNVSKFFSNCIGSTILDLEVKSTSEFPSDFTGSYSLTLPENQEQYIEKISFLLSNGNRLCFSTWMDFGLVWTEGNDGKIQFVPLSEVK